MDKKKLIKTAINVLPIIIVPLVVERKKIKDHPDVKKADESIIKIALEYGVRPRIEIGKWEDAKPYIDLGVRDFCISADIFVVAEFCKTSGDNLLKLLGR